MTAMMMVKRLGDIPETSETGVWEYGMRSRAMGGHTRCP